MRAVSLRTAMTGAWRASLARALQSHTEQVDVPAPTLPADWAASALDFGAYFDICLASLDTQSSQAKAVGEVACHWLQRRFSKKKTPPVRHSDLQVSTLSELFFSAVERARFQRWLDADPQRPLAMGGIGPSRLICATRELSQAWFALGDVAPQLRDEIAIISPEVILVRSGEMASMRFDSVSSFCLWGCMALNTEAHFSRWDYFSSLVRESAHSLLFAFARQQPLVLNPIDMRLDSPLCDEASAMDHVFHAAFVSARDVWALRRAVAHTGRLAGDDLDPQRTGLLQRLRTSEDAFWACDEQIASGAELSPLGAAILRESRNHVLSLAAGDRSCAAFDRHPTELLTC